MRLAVIYDIHGNLAALEAVLREVEKCDVDQIIVGGDVLPGPQPLETLDLLANVSKPVSWIRGNGERETLAVMKGQIAGIPEMYVESMQWVGRQLSKEQRDWLDSWPMSVTLRSPTVGEVLFCHATPRSDCEIFTKLTPEPVVQSMFGDIRAGTAVCGHTHMQFDRHVGELRIINAGSVGMPFGSPGAFWMLIDSRITLKRTEYDRERAAQNIRDTGYPLADDFVDNYLLSPPAENSMLEMFEKAVTGGAGAK